MRYAQEKGGNKLHLVYDYNGIVSRPICGYKVEGYRMTINVPLGHTCKNCLRVTDKQAKKIKREFFESILEEA